MLKIIMKTGPHDPMHVHIIAIVVAEEELLEHCALNRWYSDDCR